ncbi:hypothetical protein [Streptomyces griseoaurantiacus]|uniref:hypothetical protein n=1 Tax=Streptomyces griseoaurantiacus TaxID=68213 RepID=UPI0036D0925C
MSSFHDDLYAGIPKTVPPYGTPLRAMPAAWEATFDNKVTRHYTQAAGTAAMNAGEQVRVVDYKLNELKELLGTSEEAVAELEKRVGDVVTAMRGPESELATAQQALVDLKKRNDRVIKECRRWKGLAQKAEKVQLQNRVIAGRTPTEALRYIADKLLARPDSDGELGGMAKFLQMVAADLDKAGENPE